MFKLDNFHLGGMLSREALLSLEASAKIYIENKDKSYSSFFVEKAIYKELLIRNTITSILLFQAKFESLLNHCLLENTEINQLIEDKKKEYKKNKKSFGLLSKVEYFIEISNKTEEKYFNSYKKIYSLRNCIAHSKNESDLQRLQNINFLEYYRNYKNGWFMFLLMMEKSDINISPRNYEENWKCLISNNDYPSLEILNEELLKK